MTAETRAVLWDLDGVLVDSAWVHYEAFRELFGSMGRELTEDEFARLFGRRNDAIFREVLGELRAEEVSRLAARKEEAFRRRIADRVEALPGARELVKRLSETGVRQAIVSSTPRANIELILRSLGLVGSFEAIVGEEDVRRGKPDPEGFQTAARRLGVRPEECVVLEDAPEGIAAGNAAGMRCVGVATTRPAEKLRRADLVVDSLEDRRVRTLVLGSG
jgi:beta-phosphoglucomutase family hydrolase